MLPRYEQFIRERKYYTSVTPATVEWYQRCLKWLPSEQPSQEDLRDVVLRMRNKGLKETGCNTVIRCINAYLHWNSGSERKCDGGCTHLRVKKLREPKNVMPTFSEAQIKRFVTWKPHCRYDKRLHLLLLFLLDTGCRITEALTLRVAEIDMDNLLVTLDGKGRKQRIVPFSVELRRALYRFITENDRTPYDLLLASRTGTLWSRRNILRDVKCLCRSLGFEPPARTIHAFRHSFAVNYLRRGGSVFHLQKVLGHSTLEMTRRYSNMTVDDLSAVHPRVSLLK
jgi:integrase/recombinase XerD